MNDDELIHSLKNDLLPVRRPWPPGRVALFWLLASGAYALVLAALLGPFRPGFEAQLLTAPRFALEMLTGLGALVCFLVTALAESIPGAASRWIRFAGWALFAGWLGQFVIGFVSPALEPSMLGKRDLCVWEAYLYSVPPLLVLVRLQWRRFVLEPRSAVLHASLAAGILPALVMQIACMYEPVHALSFHVLPIALLAIAAVLVADLLVRRSAR